LHTLLLPILRDLSDGQFHSGTQLALQHQISRASVSNIIAGAASMGIVVYKVRGRGYQLANIPDWLDADKIRAAMPSTTALYRIDIVDSIDSTNTALLHAADSTPHRHCLVAEQQTAGRGRRGRVWQSLLGGSLTCSIRWRFNQGMAALAGLSLAVGIALIRTLHQLGIKDAQLKWPNDLLWQQRKLAGILIEVQGDMNGPTTAIIGIGINIQLPAAMRASIDQAVTDTQEILGHSLSRNTLLATLLTELNHVMDEFERNGLQNLRSEWNAAHAYADQPVQIQMSNGTRIQGIAVGIADNGALLLLTDDDKQISIHSGEVHHARRYSA
jgi:BirA family biotin operon repressor/biotin-[acetyl-CoA-carboxylase] ligase